jgi:hypothetical protein
MSKFVLTAQLQLQAPTNVGQVVKKIQGQLKNVNVKIEAQGAAKSTRQVQQLTKAVKQADSAAFKLGKTFTSSLKRFAAFSIATRFVSLFTQGLGSAVDEALKFERELVKIAQVTGGTIKQLGELTGAITKLSVGLGVSSSELLNVTRALSQAGFSATEAKIALDALAKSSLAPTFEDMAKTAEGAIAIFNQFGQGASALEAQLGAINAVAGKFAVEAGDLISVVRRTGGVFKAAGGDLNELIALFTSVRSTTRESAESIATGLRTIFTRIQRPTTIKFLEGLGVSLKDLEGKFVGPFEAIKRLSAALGSMKPGDLGFVQIAEQLGGFRQIGKVIPLLQQFSVAQDAYNTALGGANSLTKDAETAQQSLLVQLMKLREEWQATVRSITSGAGFKVAVTAAISLASAVLKIADALKSVLPLIAAFGAIKMAKGLGGFMAGAKAGGMSAVPKFATGGTVPGSGSRDTVPAMLTPGEFVIRKSSAQKIGSKNLQSMNAKGYASGGSVKGNINANTLGLFALRPDKGKESVGLASQTDTRTITNKKGAIKALDELYNLKLAGGNKVDSFSENLKGPEQRKILESKATGEAGNQFLAGMSESYPSLGRDSSKGALGVGSTGFTKYVKAVGSKEANASIDNALKGADNIPGADLPTQLNLNLTSGNQKELLLGQKGNDKGATAKVEKQVMDETSAALVGVAKKLTKIDKGAIGKVRGTSGVIDFHEPSFLASMEKLVKNNKGEHSAAVTTTGGFVQEGLVAGLTGAPVAGGDSAFDFPTLEGHREQLKNIYGGDFKSILSADAKPSSEKSNVRELIKKLANSMNDNPAKFVNKSYIDKLDPTAAAPATPLGPGFAKGGPAPSDTVPAMLTPGEFVVNKKAAQSIGHAGLDRMNKKGVTGFAKGGPVGFASGGGVQHLFMGGMGGGGSTGQQAMVGMMAMQTILPMVVGGLESAGKGSQELAEGANALKQGFAKGAAMLMKMMLVQTLIKNLREKGIAEQKEANEAAKSATPALRRLKKVVEDIEVPKDVDADDLSISSDSINLDVSEVTIHAKVVNLEGESGAISEAEKEVQTKRDQLAGGSTPIAVAKAKLDAADTTAQRASLGLTGARQERQGLRNKQRGHLGTADRLDVEAAEQEKIGNDRRLPFRGGASSASKAAARERAAELRAGAQTQRGQAAGVGRQIEGLDDSDRVSSAQSRVTSSGDDVRKARAEYEALVKAREGDVESLKRAKTEVENLKEKRDALTAAEEKALADAEEKQSRTDKKLAVRDAKVADAEANAPGGSAGIERRASFEGAMPDEKHGGRVRNQSAKVVRKAREIRDTKKAIGFMSTDDKVGFDGSRANLQSRLQANQASQGRVQLMGQTAAVGGPSVKDQKAKLAREEEKLTKALKKAEKQHRDYAKTLKKNKGDLTKLRSEYSALKTGLKKNGGGFLMRLKGMTKALAARTKEIAKGGKLGGGANLKRGGVGLAKGLMGAAPVAGAIAEGMMQSLVSYQGMQFDKALASGTPADLATARGEVGANVDSEMAGERLSDTMNGVMAGASMGAMVGSLAGPIGTVVGGVLGGVVGGVGGFFKDEIFSAMGIGPSREEKREQKTNERNSRIAETDLTKNIGPAMQKSMESFATEGGSDKDFSGTMKQMDAAKQAIGIMRKANPEKADAADKAQENVAKQFSISIGSTATSSAQLDKRIRELSAKFPKLREELEKTAKSAFMVAEANRAVLKMRADMLGTSSIFRAAGLEVNNFIDGLKTGANSWNATVNTLKEAKQNIALGGDASAAVKEARGRVNKRLKESGIEETSEAGQMVNRQFDLMDNAAQFSSNLPGILKTMQVDMGASTNEKIKGDISNELMSAAGVDADSQMGKVIAARVDQLTPEQMGGLRSGDLQLSDLFSDLQGQISQLGAGALAAAQAMQAHENTMLKLTAVRIKSEQNLIAMQKQAINLQLEGAMIASKFGGAAVGPDAKREAALKKFNLGANRLGAGALTTGSGGDIKNASAALARKSATQELQSRGSGAFGGTQGLEADKRNELNKAQMELVGVTRALIQADKEELAIIQKKNALEKSSLDALMDGNVDKFFEQQSAAQATQVLASGDTTSLAGFSGDTLNAARKNIQEQKAAGVSEIGGVDIGTMEARATQAALASRGIVDPRAAALASGQTQEEQEIEGRIRDRAGALGAIGENMVDLAEMQVQTATINIATADVKFKEGLNSAAGQFNALTPARGGFIGSNAVYRALGGSIFKPKGTDTVPAMLTPGEFVVNRAAVNRDGNLALLRAINSGNQSSEAAPAATMSQGGSVRYYSGGSPNTVQANGGADASMLEGLNAFNSAFAKNIANLQNTKFQIKLDTTSVNVNLNGGSFLNSLKEEIKSELLVEVGSQISNLKFTDAGDAKPNGSVLG